MEYGNAIEIQFRNASLKDVDREAAQLKSMYDVYRTLRTITPSPGDLTMDFEIRGAGETISAKDVTSERLLADAARFRILRGIREHVINNVGDVQSFDLAFDLKCREIPDEIEIPEIGGQTGPIIR